MSEEKDEQTAALTQTRGSVYGPFVGNADVAQTLKNEMRDSKNWGSMRSDICEALDLIALKISRILTGNDPEYLDNFDDIAGYARCVADRIRREKGSPKT